MKSSAYSSPTRRATSIATYRSAQKSTNRIANGAGEVSLMITPTNASLRRESLTGLPAAGTPAAIAQSITGRPYISWSQVQQYQMCPRAFEFKYVLKAE